MENIIKEEAKKLNMLLVSDSVFKYVAACVEADMEDEDEAEHAMGRRPEGTWEERARRFSVINLKEVRDFHNR